MTASERRDSLYRSFFEAGIEGMLIVSEGGALVDANPRVCDMLGYEREELLGMGLRAVADLSDDRWEAVLGGRSLDERGIELRMSRRDGTSLVVRTEVASMPEESGGGSWSLVLRQPN